MSALKPGDPCPDCGEKMDADHIGEANEMVTSTKHSDEIYDQSQWC